MSNRMKVPEEILSQLKALEQFDTPTLSNSIERFQIRSRVEGVAGSEIREIIPTGRTYIGFACTAKISAAAPGEGDTEKIARAYFENLAASPRPSIAVIEDLDPKPVGSVWGEVNVTVHRALGCIATVTNGGVRDLNEVSSMGFGYYASSVLVSHGYVHFEDCGCPVMVGGLEIMPGDLIAADQHGVLHIPTEIVPELLAAVEKTTAAELAVLEGCRKAISIGEDISVDDLMKWRQQMYRLRVSDTL